MRTEETFPVELQSTTAARHFVTGVLDGAGASSRRDDAELLTSELVANAVLHARTAFRVAVDVDDRRLRVEVHDASSGTPVRRRPDARATGGRGVLIVDAVADRWGVDPDVDGKVVWFELDASPTAEPPGAGPAGDVG